MWDRNNNSNWGNNNQGGNGGGNWGNNRPSYPPRNGGGGGYGGQRGGGSNFGGPKPPKRDPNAPITVMPSRDGLLVDSPYSQDFVAGAKEVGGRWNGDARRWMFDPRDESRVIELLNRVFPGWNTRAAAPAAAPVEPSRAFSRQPTLPSRPSSTVNPWDADREPQLPENAQNGVARSDVAPAFLDAAQATPDGSALPADNKDDPDQKIKAQVKSRLHRLGEELSGIDFNALSAEDLFAFSDRLANAARVLAFEAGVRHK